MRFCFPVGVLAFAATLSLSAQSTCSATRVADVAASANSLRQTLAGTVVHEGDRMIAPALSTRLLKFKQALAATADAVFTCAPASASAEQLQSSLADALHATPAAAGESVTDARSGLEKGAYASGLSVQIFELFGAPRIFEVDFRYNIECGDDHLLLVFQAAGDTSAAGWHEQLRYGSNAYKTVSDAIGDFVLLTPLTGDDQHRTWHYLVANGHPACKVTPRPSTFDLTLLTPAADPASPNLDWHFEHPYTAGSFTPRLATTEDTIEFRLTPVPTGSAAQPAQGTAAGAETYRFRLTPAGHVEPLPAQATEASTAAQARSTSTDR